MPTRATDSRSEENHLSVENDNRGGQKGCKQPTSGKEEDAAIAWRGMGEGAERGRVSENKSHYQVNKKCEPARANQAGPRQRLGSVAKPLLFFFFLFFFRNNKYQLVSPEQQCPIFSLRHLTYTERLDGWKGSWDGSAGAAVSSDERADWVTLTLRCGGDASRGGV